MMSRCEMLEFSFDMFLLRSNMTQCERSSSSVKHCFVIERRVFVNENVFYAKMQYRKVRIGKSFAVAHPVEKLLAIERPSGAHLSDCCRRFASRVQHSQHRYAKRNTRRSWLSTKTSPPASAFPTRRPNSEL